MRSPNTPERAKLGPNLLGLGFQLGEAFVEEAFHFHEFGDELVLALEEIRIDRLGGCGFGLKLRQEGAHAIILGLGGSEALFAFSEHSVERLVEVLVAELKFFEDDLAATFAIAYSLLVRGATLAIEGINVEGNVFCAVERTGANVFHEGGIATTCSLLAILANALDGAFLSHNLRSHASPTL